MPRIAHDRDDLWDELRAYPIRLDVNWPAREASHPAIGAPTIRSEDPSAPGERAGLAPWPAGDAGQAVIGFKANGCASFYFGPDRVYHFNSAGELRRAFVNTSLFKAELGRLIRLVRHPTAATIELRRTELDAATAQQFLATAQRHLNALAAVIRSGQFTLAAEIPAGLGLPRLQSWLATCPAALAIAAAPHAR